MEFLYFATIASVLTAVEASWWLLAMPSTAYVPGFGHSDCESSPLLVSRQRQLCALSPNMIPVVSQGAQMGLRECAAQFAGRHWNCSTQAPRKAAPSKLKKRRLRPASGDADAVFGRSLEIKSREKAYVHAISAAGVAFAITRACAVGNLSSCGCDGLVHTRNHRNLLKKAEPFEWGGCSEDVEYGVAVGSDFVDAADGEAAADPETRLMNLHNNHAGTKAVRRGGELQCKCHGVSGSCSTRVCWRRLGNFAAVGKRLFRKFHDAVQVQLAGGRSTRSASVPPRLTAKSFGTGTASPPRKQDLVYTEESPDYCHPDAARGIVGTAGRICVAKGTGSDSCDILCCGRGFKEEILETTEDCNCNFVWCCKVQCDTCRKSRLVSYCR